MAADKTATFSIRVPVETNAGEAADSIDSLRKSVFASQDAVKGYSSSLRNLRGSSDEVKAAKDQLKSAINAERDAISRNVLELGKHGKVLSEVAVKSREAAKASAGGNKTFSEVKDALGAIGGPAKDLNDKFGSMTEVLGKAGTAGGAFGLAAGAMIAVVVALGAAVYATGQKIVSFVLEMGNLNRVQELNREAALGSSANAKAFGTQIDDIAKRVPLARAKLEEFAVSVSRSFRGTKIGGDGLIDTYEAITAAAAANGDAAGAKINEVIERGKQFGRIGIGLRELQNIGLDFGDVAAPLAKNLKIGLQAARNMLYMHRVPIDQGAKAIRDAVEKRFEKINLEKMLTLDNLVQKFKDNLQKLANADAIKPILVGLSKIVDLFGEDTVMGYALKGIFKDIGDTASRAFDELLPVATKAMKSVIIGILELEIAALKLNKTFKSVFGEDALTAFKEFTDAVTDLLGGETKALEKFGDAVDKNIKRVFLVVKTIGDMYLDLEKFLDSFHIKWVEFGKNIVNGIIEGLTAGVPFLNSAMHALGFGAETAFRKSIDSHSPSKLFMAAGEDISLGTSQGVDKGKGQVESSVASMVSVPSSIGGGGGNGGGGGGNTVSVTMNLAFPNAKDGAGVKDALMSSSFKAQFTSMLEDMLQGAGIPTQTPPDEVI